MAKNTMGEKEWGFRDSLNASLSIHFTLSFLGDMIQEYSNKSPDLAVSG